MTPPLTHHERVSKLAWSPDGALLATASDDGVTRVWDAASGQPVTPPLVHRVFLTAVVWSPDGRHLATASADKTARVWDVWDAGTLADWRAAAERCDYRLNSAGVPVERDPVPDEHSSAAGLLSAGPSSSAGQGSSGSPVPAAEVHRSKLERYVWEAFPAWQREHPGRQCPDSIDQLNKYIGAVDSLDESGQQIQALCGPTLTATDRRFGIVFNVRVAGADGVFGTDDDGYPF